MSWLSRGPVNGINQCLSIDRFSEEGHCSKLSGSLAAVRIVKGRNNDHRHSNSHRCKFLLEVKPGQPRHADVQNDARSFVKIPALQKFFPRSEDSHLKVGRPQKPLEGPPDRFVVVNDIDHRNVPPERFKYCREIWISNTTLIGISPAVYWTLVLHEGRESRVEGKKCREMSVEGKN